MLYSAYREIRNGATRKAYDGMEGSYSEREGPRLRYRDPRCCDPGRRYRTGAIWAASLLLEHAGHTTARARVLGALEEAIASGVKTPDLGGTASTAEVTEAVIGRLSEAPGE